MQPTRPTWTDERLDDLSARVEGGFDRVDRDIRELRGEIHAGLSRIDGRFTDIDERFTHLDVRFAHLDVRFRQIDERFAHLDERFDDIQRSINRFGAAVFLTFLTALVGLFFGHG